MPLDEIEVRKPTNYKASSDEHKAEMLTEDIKTHLYFITKDRVDLNNFEMVKDRTEDYIRICAEKSVFPTIMGLCSSLGVGRTTFYRYLRNHDNKVTEYFDSIRTSFASILTNESLYKNADSIMTIFLLKNSSLGFKDKIDIESEVVHTGYSKLSAEELLEQAELLPD